MNGHRILLASLGCLAALFSAGCALAEDEPVYNGQTLTVWLDQLRTAKHQDWEKIAKEIGKIGKPAIPRLIQETETANQIPGDFRWRLTTAFSLVGPDAVPALIAAFKEADPLKKGDRKFAPLSEVLAKIGKEALPALNDLLKSADQAERYKAVATLKQMGGKVPEAMPFVLMALKDNDDWIRENAAEALGRFGLPSVDGLVAALADKTGRVRMHAMESLGKISRSHALPDSVLPAVTLGLDDDDDAVPAHAARVLMSMGTRAQPALPKLLNRLQDRSDYVRKACLDAIQKISLDADGVEPALAKALDNPYPEVRAAMAELLRRRGAKAQGTQQSLLLALQDKESVVRIQAISTLSAVGLDDPQSVPLLVKALNDPEAFIRIGALTILKKMGEKAKEAAPALRETAKSSDPWTRWASLEALHAIAAEPAPTAADFPRGFFAGRTPTGRAYLCGRRGGTVDTERAVEAALKWLAKHQEADGHWDAWKHAGRKVDTAVTGFALLAFLSAGHTEKVGEYKDNVERAVAWLISKQAANGLLFNTADEGEHRGIGYPGAIATLALVEAAGMANVAGTRAAAQKAINYCTDIHQHGAGADKQGWRYAAKQEGDISVTSWFLMALKSAKMAGLIVNQPSFDGAIKFIDKCEIKNAGDGEYATASRYSYKPDSGSNPRRCAIGNLIRHFLGWKKEDLQSSVELFVQEGGVPNWGNHGETADLYYWYHGTLCVFQQGGDVWTRWNESMKKALVENQCKSRHYYDHDAGSWIPVGSYAGDWGRVGQTALSALCLEVYYRYLIEAR